LWSAQDIIERIHTSVQPELVLRLIGAPETIKVGGQVIIGILTQLIFAGERGRKGVGSGILKVRDPQALPRVRVGGAVA